jgi:Fe-S cluster assembly protein SufD
MSQIRTKDWYIKNFEKFEASLNGEMASDIHKIRKDAIAAFAELDFPTIKNEDWKYTNIAPILNYNFVTPESNAELNAKDISDFYIQGLKARLLVFINGRFSEKHSSPFNDLEKLGVKIGGLDNKIKNSSGLINKYFSKYAKLNNGFAALNTAFANDGAFIFIPDDVTLNDPIHILNLAGNSQEHVLAQPRNLIVAGKNSKIKIIESYNSLDDKAHFTNVVTEVSAGENSNIDLYRIQDENMSSFQVSLTQVEQQRHSIFTIYTMTTGGALVRNDVNSVLNDEGCETHLYGLYLTDGSQHVDNHTLMDHAKPHCLSNELYKGVLNGKSRAVFNGKVYVRPDAQKTNAYQSNKNILLSKEATVDTKPQLEIFADDVKCSHGATVGQLDEESVFYLRSRGISEEKARSILIRAFANDIFEEIKIDELHEHLNKMVFEKLNNL